jgi:hypothetical protein
MLAFQTETLTSDSYFAIRQADSIRESGVPLFNDPLSYSGRVYLFQPLFEYLVALFSFFSSTVIAAKIVTALCLSSLVIVVYFTVKQITKNKNVSILAAIFAGFVPALYIDLNSTSALSLNVLLVFSLAYFFLRVDEGESASIAIVLAVLSLLTSPEIFILLLGLVFYFIILFLERTPATKKESELMLFLFFLSVWFTVLLFKKSFLETGVLTFWGNIPSSLLSNYFSEINFIGILYVFGLIPLIFGVYGAYNVVFETKSKGAQLFVGIALASFLSLWLKLVPLITGIIFFSISMIILAGHTFRSASNLFSKMKAEWISSWAAAVLILLFLATSIPFFTGIRISEPQIDSDISALEWIRDNTPETSVIAGRVEQGFLINYFSMRKNIADSNFLFVAESEKIYSEIESIYELRLSSEVIRILDKYDVNYVFLSQKTMEEKNMTGLYVADSECFEKVYEEKSIVYKFKGCKI